MTPQEVLDRLQAAAPEAAQSDPVLQQVRQALSAQQVGTGGELLSRIGGQRNLSASDLLTRMCEQMHCVFTLREEPLAAADLMRSDMFLPAVAWTVQNAGYRLLGGSLGCGLRVDQTGLFGVVASVPAVTDHIGDFMRGLFLTHYTTEMFGLRENAQIEVEPMFNALRPAFERLVSTSEVSAEGEIRWQQTPLAARPG